jgi:hypothetical protein
MSDMLDRIDVLIAEKLMRWTGMDSMGIAYWWKDGHPQVMVEAWTPTRKAAQLNEVKREIERRGWWYRLEYRPPALNHDACAKRDVLIDTMRGNAINALLDVDGMTEGEALCRATLAALGVPEVLE